MKVFNSFWPLDIWKGSENVTEGLHQRKASILNNAVE